MLGCLQPDALPGLAGVGGLVDPVAEVRAALALVLSRAEPDDVRVPGIDHHAAEGEGAAAVEDRREGDAAVLGFPQAAEGAGDVPDAGVLRVDLDVLHAAGGQGRADAAQLQALQGVGGETGGLLGARAGPRTPPRRPLPLTGFVVSCERHSGKAAILSRRPPPHPCGRASCVEHDVHLTRLLAASRKHARWPAVAAVHAGSHSRHLGNFYRQCSGLDELRHDGRSAEARRHQRPRRHGAIDDPLRRQRQAGLHDLQGAADRAAAREDVAQPDQGGHLGRGSAVLSARWRGRHSHRRRRGSEPGSGQARRRRQHHHAAARAPELPDPRQDLPPQDEGNRPRQLHRERVLEERHPPDVPEQGVFRRRALRRRSRRARATSERAPRI